MQANQVHRLRVWSAVHKWTSLIATLFLLMLCITGLPLVFDDEISDWLNPPVIAEVPSGTPAPTLDTIVATALAKHPGDVMTSLGFVKDRPAVVTHSAATPRAPLSQSHRGTYDLRTGKPTDLQAQRRGPVMTFIRELHTDMFLGLAGALFLGAMALLLIVAIISGIVIYAPFMHRLAFGTVRKDRSARTTWLDLHNLLGIVTVAWLLAVSVTGAINTLHDPVADAVRADIFRMGKTYGGSAPKQLTSIDAALATAKKALPDGKLVSFFFPGAGFSTPHHYAIFARGNQPITSQLFYAALVDAETGELTRTYEMPWYAKALLLSQPLHFGDYGGLPLKIVWALFDFVTIVVLGSGLYLWIAKWRRARKSRIAIDAVQAA
ncbi:PepSY domain-containing protein [Tardiphaga alba]|uniref:PepSY domain-containing protein n=1 Tax=Tardiphaga alba TaxID=340268 RepID=A0ABX8A7T3_9BRAD|nr:PepSY domain-containing protein [Tardiphaga alba]